MPRLIDTHSHLNFSEFDNDRNEVIARSLEKGVFMINVGVNCASSRQAIKIAAQYENGVWAAIGLHPQNIGTNSEKDFLQLENIKEADFNSVLYRGLAQTSKKIVAIGEIGLDYQGLPKSEAKAELIKQKQIDVFKKQLVFSRELGLPVIIHSRMAHSDLINILREEQKQGSINGVIHCFTGTIDEARQYYDLGLFFGLNGIIFKLDLNAAIAQIPLDRILLETDCPFLSPLPELRRNEPQYVRSIVEKVAWIRNVDIDLITEAAIANANKLFKI